MTAASDNGVVAGTCVDCRFLDVAVVDVIIAVASVDIVVIAFFFSLVAFVDFYGVIAGACLNRSVAVYRAINRNGVVTFAGVYADVVAAVEDVVVAVKM